MRVYLNPQGGTAALQQKVLDMSDPQSANYRQWLTVDQYNAAYQPTQATVDAVSTYLTAQGLTVDGVESAHRYITASGYTGQLDQAFGVTLGTYSHDGQTVTAPANAVTVPADIGAAMLTVTGLDTTVTKFSHRNVTPDVDPASLVRQRSAVQHQLRQPAGQIPGRLHNTAAAFPGQIPPLRAVRLHRAAIPGRLRR